MIKLYIYLKTSFEWLNQVIFKWAQTTKYDAKGRKWRRTQKEWSLDRNSKQETKKFYRKFGFKNINTVWHSIFSNTYGEFHKEFVSPSQFYSSIEPALNRCEFDVLQDKNLLDVLFKDFKTPKTIVKNINGFYLNDIRICSRDEAVELLNGLAGFLIKPSLDTGGGRGVEVFHFDDQNDRTKSIIATLEKYKKDFIVQEFLEQSPELAQFNPTSINTIRIITYIDELNGIQILLSALRIGAKGKYVDNSNSGGVFCNIDKSGHLGKSVFSTELEVRYSTDIGKVTNGERISSYHKVEDMVKEMHLHLPYFRMVSWDIAIDGNNEPVLIEFNVTSQGITWQAAAGPLFGKFTEEILKKVN